VLFNTVSYLFFLAISVAIFWVLPQSRRQWLILTASIVFYALWRWEFVLLIMFSAFVDYYFSLKIYDEDDPRRRKLWLLCSLTTNLGLLGYFKYTYFIVDNIRLIGGSLGENWTLHPGTIILPLGISFYTFLSISYTLDVYRRLFKPVRNFALYLSYVMFWPHMIAGPILRAHELIPQLVRYEAFDINLIAVGVRRILFGLFLKVALADQLAPFVDDAFLANPLSLSALDVWTMAFGFGLQIYFDFAGYSMIAIGSALLLGIHFPENFNWPYMAKSPREFWKRWHITLSSWIRDYLYLPLSGIHYQDRSEGGLEIQFKAGNTLRMTFALFATWFLMGLWHGANWTFAFWGLWHATFIWFYRIISPRVRRVPSLFTTVVGWGTTLAISMLAWIPFRARSLEDSFVLIGRVLDWHAYSTLSFRENFYLIVAIIFVGMIAMHYASIILRQYKYELPRQMAEIGLVAICGFVVFIFLRPTNQFIYFQF
jgi:alginate O-acetyltransferase complex protein AlgI